MALFAAGVSAVPASATVVPTAPIPADHNITVFHNIDFVATFGWGAQELTVQVERNGVIIGTTTGPTVDVEGGALEVNHGPEGAPALGDCFEGHTPDIRPGDTVRVIHAGGISEVIVDNITLSGDPTVNPITQDVEVRGVAQRHDGAAIPASFLDSGEFRDVLPSGQFRATPTIEADPSSTIAGAFVMLYPDPYLGDVKHPAASTVEERKQSLLTSGGHATGFGHVAVLPAESMLVDGLEDTPGPALGCEASVAGGDAVTDLSDDVLNAADVAAGVAAGGNLTISGATFDAENVAVTVGNLPVPDAVITGDPGGPQSWTTSVPMDDVAGLVDGTISVSMAVTRTGAANPIAGVAKTLVIDRVAPAAPTASPNGGSFIGSTNVTLSGAAGDAFRYTLGNGSQAAPTPSTGSAYVGAIPLSQSATLKAIAIDEAGNVSSVLSQPFTVTAPPAPPAPPAPAPPAPPAPAAPAAPAASSTVGGSSSAIVSLAPSIARARSGKAGGARTATVTWRAPSANGAVVQGYEVRVFRIRPGKSAKVSRIVEVGPNVRKLKLALRAGKYRFQVRAVSAAGDSPWSAKSGKVRAR